MAVPDSPPSPPTEEERIKQVEEPQPPPQQDPNTRDAWRFQLRLAIAIALPVFLETLDYTVVATAQTKIASTFNRLDLQSYIGTSYVLTSTVFLPLWASFADIFGRHMALQMSLFTFMLGSALSTAAQNMPMMLAGRGVAGVGAAGLLTVVRTLLADTRSINANNTQGTILVILYAIGFSVGPVIGGFLTEISFRWVFAINLPCCAVSIVLVFVLLHNRVVKSVQSRRLRDEHASFLQNLQRVDTIGALLFIAGGILLLLGLNWGSTSAWNTARVIASLILGGLLLIAFVSWEYLLERYEMVDEPPTLYRADAMIPLAVFTNYDVSATEFAAFASGMIMLACFYFLSVLFVIVYGKTSVQAGVQLVFFAPGMGLGTIIGLSIVKHLRQPKYAIVLGGLVLPIALGFLSMAINDNKRVIVDVLLAVAGTGVGLTFGPLAIHARFSQPQGRVAVVIALNLFFRTFGGTIGIAQCAAVLDAKVRTYVRSLAVAGVISPSDLQALSASSLSSLQGINALPPALAQHVRDAFRMGTRWSFISLIPWTVISFVLVLFLSPIEDTDKSHGQQQGDGAAVVHGGVAGVDAEKRAAVAGDMESTPSPATGAARTVTVPQATEPKPRIYGPVSLIAYGVRKAMAKRQARNAASASPAQAAV